MQDLDEVLETWYSGKTRHNEAALVNMKLQLSLTHPT